MEEEMVDGKAVLGALQHLLNPAVIDLLSRREESRSYYKA